MKIKIKFTDFPGPWIPNSILKILQSKYDVVIEDKNPEYVIYSVFGYEFLKYKNVVRIFFTGENVHPDFNLCDYAFGFDWLILEDRYFRCPNYVFYKEYSDIISNQSENKKIKKSNDNYFCNFIYSNGNAHPFREKLFVELSKYKSIHSAGKFINNTGIIPGEGLPSWESTQAKIQYQSKFKFSLAIENSSTTGYTTEKIVHALAAKTIPIYWGNPAIAREFNHERFINCHKYNSIEEIVESIKAIDLNNELYNQILNSPCFSKENIANRPSLEKLLENFDYIFNQGRSAIRRNEYVWGDIYEKKLESLIEKKTNRNLINYCKNLLQFK